MEIRPARVDCRCDYPTKYGDREVGRCTLIAKYRVNGRAACKRHAQGEALNHMVESYHEKA